MFFLVAMADIRMGSCQVRMPTFPHLATHLISHLIPFTVYCQLDEATEIIKVQSFLFLPFHVVIRRPLSPPSWLFSSVPPVMMSKSVSLEKCETSPVTHPFVFHSSSTPFESPASECERRVEPIHSMYNAPMSSRSHVSILAQMPRPSNVEHPSSATSYDFQTLKSMSN